MSPYLTFTDFLPASTDSTGVPVEIVMFCFLKVRSTTLAMSLSSAGRIWSSISIRVTSVPKRPYAEAISAPDAPAPTTAIDFGCSGSDQAPHVSTTRSPNSTPGIASATDPVARTTGPAS